MNVKERDSHMIESMGLSKTSKTKEPAMVFLKQRAKNKGKVIHAKTDERVVRRSKLNWNQTVPKKEEDTAALDFDDKGFGEVKLKAAKRKSKKEKKIKSCGDKRERKDIKRNLELKDINKPKFKDKSAKKDSNIFKNDYQMDIFISESSKKGIRKTSIGREKICKQYLKKDMETSKKRISKVERNSKYSQIVNLNTESSKERSRNCSKKKHRESFRSGMISSRVSSSFKIEDFLEKVGESTQLMQIFMEQKEEILQNKKVLGQQINKIFMTLLTSLEQERAKFLKVLDKKFHFQTEKVFMIEKKMNLCSQNLKDTSQYGSAILLFSQYLKNSFLSRLFNLSYQFPFCIYLLLTAVFIII